MNEKLNMTMQQVLADKPDNYILPFFWQHGESEEVLRKYMEVIKNSNIHEVCLEARPHPDFAGPGWWHDLDIILDEAVKRNMRVWILDDAHFPTGQAGGKMINHDISLQKQFVMNKRIELTGATPQVTIDIASNACNKKPPFSFGGDSPFNRDQFETWYDDDSLLRVVAYPISHSGAAGMDYIDLTDQVDADGMLSWDVPAGKWALYIYFLTRNGCGRCGYINMLSEESCAVQIEEVYEPHWKHYKQYFGNTIAGFFSDEPCVGNVKGFDFDEYLGKKQMLLPWSKEVPELMANRLGEDWYPYLAALWTDLEDKDLTARIRYAYMDICTELINHSFARQLGSWCEAHGVEYIGHIVEDKNQHARFGSSQGHFFRSMEGQHMSGIDDIGGQVMPEGEHVSRTTLMGSPGASGEFFHYELGKLGSSFAHIDPKKKGRAMCEIFGAYGWGEGVHLEKYLVDHFLARGINRYVPHAFSGKDFPDPDCPPHFYAHGNNPQYRHFGVLMAYLNRMCHIIDKGKSIAPAAVLYHGESEWVNGGHAMLNETVCAPLMEAQIDLDIIPSDVFTKRDLYQTDTTDGLCVNDNHYRTLIIPYTEYLTCAVAEFVAASGKAGFPVIFVDGYPKGLCDSFDDHTQLLSDVCAASKVVALTDLAAYIRSLGLADLSITPAFPQLRYYRYEKENAAFYVINNESTGRDYTGELTLENPGSYLPSQLALYEGMTNRLYRIPVRAEGGKLIASVTVCPYEEVVLVLDPAIDSSLLPVWKPQRTEILRLDGSWKISCAEALAYPDFTPVCETTELANFGRIKPDFSGFIAYESSFTLNCLPRELILKLADAYEGVEVFVNGKNAGIAICQPYEIEISDLVTEGTNTLRIEVATTLQRKMANAGGGMMAMFSKGAPLDPTGLIGTPVLLS